MSRIFLCICFLGICLHSVAAAQTAAPSAQELITKYLARAEEYTATFKNLTAEETKYIEDYDSDDTIKKRRTIVSELLVYQPTVGFEGIPAEYRSVRSVDGKSLPDAEKRALKLFQDIAKAKSGYEEWERVRKEWAKYDGARSWWGFTINQGVALKASRAYYVFAAIGEEMIAGRKTYIVFYRQVERSPHYTGPTYMAYDIRKFEAYRGLPVLFVGKLWLDAETSQLHREERAMVVYVPTVEANFTTSQQLRDLLTGPRAGELKALTIAHWKLAYQTSEFGIMTPKQIEISLYSHFHQEKAAEGLVAPELRLSHRTRYDYGAFKRFDVTGEETKREIIKP